MKNTSKTILLMALLAGAMAAGSLKHRLGQQASKNLVQAESESWFDGLNCEQPVFQQPPVLPECPCNFTDLPGLSSGVQTGFSQTAQALQSAVLTSVPDTQFTQICQSNCCSCEEAAHASNANASKNRTFTINGSITVLETVKLQESGSAAENSKGRSQKDTICQTNNAQGGLGGGPNCINVTVCPTLGSSLEANGGN